MGEGCPWRVGVCLKGDMIPSYWLVIFGGIWWSYISGILMVTIQIFFWADSSQTSLDAYLLDSPVRYSITQTF